MSYDHAKKVGNKGDVWKHFILLTVLKALIEDRKDEVGQFRYFDTHAGQGLYSLPEDGEWRRGVGKVLPGAQNLREHPYFQTLGKRVGPGTAYLGSWLLAGQFLSDRGEPFGLELCDTSPSIVNAVDTHALSEAIRSAVAFRQADGFVELRRRPDCDLALIDPPYHPRADRDWKRCFEIAETLRHGRTAYLIWYPVFWHTKPTELVGRADTAGFEVLWACMGQKPSQNQKGCGILAGGGTEQILCTVSNELRELAGLLGGELFVRRVP